MEINQPVEEYINGLKYNEQSLQKIEKLGSIFVLIGEPKCGKSTFLSYLLGEKITKKWNATTNKYEMIVEDRLQKQTTNKFKKYIVDGLQLLNYQLSDNTIISLIQINDIPDTVQLLLTFTALEQLLSYNKRFSILIILALENIKTNLARYLQSVLNIENVNIRIIITKVVDKSSIQIKQLTEEIIKKNPKLMQVIRKKQIIIFNDQLVAQTSLKVLQDLKDEQSNPDIKIINKISSMKQSTISYGNKINSKQYLNGNSYKFIKYASSFINFNTLKPKLLAIYKSAYNYLQKIINIQNLLVLHHFQQLRNKQYSLDKQIITNLVKCMPKELKFLLKFTAYKDIQIDKILAYSYKNITLQHFLHFIYEINKINKIKQKQKQKFDFTIFGKILISVCTTWLQVVKNETMIEDYLINFIHQIINLIDIIRWINEDQSLEQEFINDLAKLSSFNEKVSNMIKKNKLMEEMIKDPVVKKCMKENLQIMQMIYSYLDLDRQNKNFELYLHGQQLNYVKDYHKVHEIAQEKIQYPVEDRTNFTVQEIWAQEDSVQTLYQLICNISLHRDDIAIENIKQQIRKCVRILEKYSFFQQAILYSMITNDTRKIKESLIEGFKLAQIKSQFIRDNVLFSYCMDQNYRQDIITLCFNHLNTHLVNSRQKHIKLELKYAEYLQNFGMKVQIAKFMNYKSIENIKPKELYKRVKKQHLRMQQSSLMVVQEYILNKFSDKCLS